MKASMSAMGKHQVKEITEVGEGEIGKVGEEDVDGMKGREWVVDEVIERVKRDPESDEHQQGSYGTSLNRIYPIPCLLIAYLLDPLEGMLNSALGKVLSREHGCCTLMESCI